MFPYSHSGFGSTLFFDIARIPRIIGDMFKQNGRVNRKYFPVAFGSSEGEEPPAEHIVSHLFQVLDHFHIIYIMCFFRTLFGGNSNIAYHLILIKGHPAGFEEQDQQF
jgi:hypothetical protein